MKKICSILYCSLFCTLACCQPEEFPISWLCGTWQVEGREIFEEWDCGDGEMTGRAWRIVDGERIPTEELSIRYIRDTLYYIPIAFGQNDDQPVYFALTEQREGFLRFENPEHDFPRWIQYKRISDTHVEAGVGGEDRSFTIHFLKRD